jgi:hypothetical protein
VALPLSIKTLVLLVLVHHAGWIKKYPIYSALHRVPEETKRKNFEQGKVEHPILSAINIGVAGTCTGNECAARFKSAA